MRTLKQQLIDNILDTLLPRVIQLLNETEKKEYNYFPGSSEWSIKKTKDSEYMLVNIDWSDLFSYSFKNKTTLNIQVLQTKNVSDLTIISNVLIGMATVLKRRVDEILETLQIGKDIKKEIFNIRNLLIEKVNAS